MALMAQISGIMQRNAHLGLIRILRKPIWLDTYPQKAHMGMASLKLQHVKALVGCQTRPRQRRHMDRLMSYGRKVQVVLTRVDLMVLTPVSITIAVPPSTASSANQ